MIIIRKNKNNEKYIDALIRHIKYSYEINNQKNIKKILKTKPVNEIIEALEQIEDIEIIKFVLVSAIGIKIGKIFEFLSYEKKKDIIEYSNNKLIKEIFNDLDFRDIYDNITELPKKLYKKMIISMSSDARKRIKILGNYEESEIGSIMDNSFLKINSEWTINKTIKEIQDNRDKFKINTVLYVVNNDDELIGKTTISDIVFKKNRNMKIKQIINESVISANINDEIEDIILLFQKYDIESIPIIDNNILVGVVDDNEILSAIEQETTEDIYEMYGIKELEKPYIRANVFSIVKSRIFWLILLMIASTITSAVIQLLDSWGNIITSGLSTLLLVPIIPVITGTSGNAGSQSAATVIRNLSIGQISSDEYWKVLRKEIYVAILLSFILSVINFVRLIIYFSIFQVKNEDLTNLIIKDPIILGVIISFAISLVLFISVILSKIIGAILPIIAFKLNLDPTSMASPLLTTLIDTLTTSLLFGFGTWIITFLLKG